MEVSRLALRKAGFRGKIIGVSSPQTIEAALDRRVIDEALPLRDAAGQSDLIYLAQPIERIISTLEEIDPHGCRPGTLITDAGSTKAVDRASAPRNKSAAAASSAATPWLVNNRAEWRKRTRIYFNGGPTF